MPNKSGELTYQELPDATLDDLHAAIRPGAGFASKSDLLAEIERRRTRDETDRIVRAAETTQRLTWAIAIMTVVIAFATLALLIRG